MCRIKELMPAIATQKFVRISVSAFHISHLYEGDIPYNMQVTHTFLEDVADSSGATHVLILIE